ncbi:MAG: CHRD domain-containing protein [Rhodoferax sp.]
MAAAVLVVAGCATVKPEPNLVAFSTTLRGGNEVPPVMTDATGKVYAVLNKTNLLLRWKMTYSGLSGPATMAHFHGPAAVGTNARIQLPFQLPIASPYAGQATLTPTQASELMAGQWYVNIHTRAHPGGEIRGWMVVQQ